MRIMLAGFRHESNTFASTRASYEDFVHGGSGPPLSRGAEILTFKSLNLPVAGFMKEAEANGHTFVPSVWANAIPSAPVERETFERLTNEIVDAARQHAPDAIYLDLHGAMVAEHVDDGEGELLSRLRTAIGGNIPFVASLDLHANMTGRMLDHANGLVAYRTYPHVDMAETGKRAARLLEVMLGGKPLHRAVRRVPFLIPINAMSTMFEPAKAVYERLAELEVGDVASLSFTPGFPAADFPECGPVIWGYGHDLDAVNRAVDELYECVVAQESNWRVQFLSADEAVAEAIRIARGADKPVVIADTQDNPGAGGDSNTTGILKALVGQRAEDAVLGIFYDPAAASAAHTAGVGAAISLQLGAQSGDGFEGTFRVEHLSDGRCICHGEMLAGATIELGPTACLSIGGVRIVVASAKVQMLDRAFYKVAGIDPETAKIVVNKSSVHFRADFERMAEAVLIAKSPGSMIADPADIPWTRLAHGMKVSPNGKVFEL
ncbi:MULTISPECIES: M81 family metallopeptidase [Paraburkholderia]|uniref:M81 family metallopeptidase n=1 Tax=Paraburkholderia TaxID=1822464 RepID=UPI00224FF204|nr:MULTISPECIES: M81 family metallopeptidase [Paraburkholderia]MCX4163479.1 M81 family metallopeptidase [Paraburkholderia megapolitana]MDN7158974.1 M81 family metallopeptidase [Paraburkholderia sp. CHISQ3]MDQ6496021.1 M81 family metallopeptidase [Paraburkholderia megapolitana]